MQSSAGITRNSGENGQALLAFKWLLLLFNLCCKRHVNIAGLSLRRSVRKAQERLSTGTPTKAAPTQRPRGDKSQGGPTGSTPKPAEKSGNPNYRPPRGKGQAGPCAGSLEEVEKWTAGRKACRFFATSLSVREAEVLLKMYIDALKGIHVMGALLGTLCIFFYQLLCAFSPINSISK